MGVSAAVFTYLTYLDVLTACCYPPGYPIVTWSSIFWTAPSALASGDWLGVIGVLAFAGTTLPIAILVGVRGATRFAALVGFVYESTLAITVPHVMGVQVLDLLQRARIGPPTYSGYYFFSNVNVWFACTAYLLWPHMKGTPAQRGVGSDKIPLLSNLKWIYEIWGVWVLLLVLTGMFSITPFPSYVGFVPAGAIILPSHVGPWPLVVASAVPAVLLLYLDERLPLRLFGPPAMKTLETLSETGA